MQFRLAAIEPTLTIEQSTQRQQKLYPEAAVYSESLSWQGTRCGVRRPSQLKLAVLASHPIQYQVPLFRALANCPEIDLHVFFCCRWGLERYQDPGFEISFSWDLPLLDGYKYTFLRNLSLRPGPSHFWGVINPGAFSAIFRGGFDAIWIHGWYLASNWIAWATGVSTRTPILLRGESNGLAEPGGFKGVVKRTVLAALFKRISGFLAIGTNNANFYKSYGVPEEKIFWTPYTVANDFFMEHARRLAGQKRVLREKEGIPPDCPIILFCGKFQEKKRPLDLLKAFALLGRCSKTGLVFVGEGPLRAEMEQFIAKHQLNGIYFLGFRNQTELPACYALADVLVLPSCFEPWGLVINEAMCFGLPVIASDQVGAAADLVRQGVNGFTYPSGNAQALADALRHVLVDEGVRQEMGRQSRTLISHWGIREDIDGVLTALHKVTGKGALTGAHGTGC